MTSHTTSRRVKDVVVRDVVYVNPQDTLREAADLLVENRLSALPVIDAHRRCIGFLSVTDLMGITHEDPSYDAEALSAGPDTALLTRLMEKPDIDERIVQEYMSDIVFSVSLESSLRDAAQAMTRHRVHRLAVVDGDQKLQGIISTMDIVTAVANDEPV